MRYAHNAERVLGVPSQAVALLADADAARAADRRRAAHQLRAPAPLRRHLGRRGLPRRARRARPAARWSSSCRASPARATAVVSRAPGWRGSRATSPRRARVRARRGSPRRRKCRAVQPLAVLPQLGDGLGPAQRARRGAAPPRERRARARRPARRITRPPLVSTTNDSDRSWSIAACTSASVALSSGSGCSLLVATGDEAVERRRVGVGDRVLFRPGRRARGLRAARGHGVSLALRRSGVERSGGLLAHR